MAPKSGGREGKIEEKRATNAANREMRDRDSAAGLEVSESVLMGDDGGIQAA
jgi:putative heme degradation protein